MNLSDEKLRHLQALSDDHGAIAALAMDQRGNLLQAIAAAKGIDRKDVTPEMMAEFKTAVTKVLSPHASAILLDPEFGLEAAKFRGKNTGLLLAYEKSGYDNTRPGRLPSLLPNVSVKRIRDWDAQAAKILMHYTPFEDARINEVKHAFIERVGAECLANDLPFFLEVVGYDPNGGDEKGLEFAKLKPEIVKRSMEEFSKPHYHVDVLKVEVPVNLQFVEGNAAYRGQKAYSKEEALEHFRRAAAAAGIPFIYLSAGVGHQQFIESLRMAAEAKADFSGVLCGRATWKEGIAVYASQGVKALEDWLAGEGVKNIQEVNEAVTAARPWRDKLGLA